MQNEIQVFQVSLKALVIRDDQLLLVLGDDRDPHWELPGGRMDVGEETLPLEDVLRREVREELGAEFRYAIQSPMMLWTRYLAPIRKHVLLVGYYCTYESGDVRLSDEHREYRWVGRTDWQTLPLAPSYFEMLTNFWNRLKPIS